VVGTGRWCATHQEFDDALWAQVDRDRPVTRDTRGDTLDWISLRETLSSFIGQHFRGGLVMVKTSTAGRRSSDHEVAAPLLDWVLRSVVALVPRHSVVLADGPAERISYEHECRRFGWDAQAADKGVSLLDLNNDAAVELVRDWPISKTYATADLVINLTKAKTHRRFGVSLAEKSLLGVLSGAELDFPKLRGAHDKAIWLLGELRRYSPPIFSVIDGFAAIQGEGPLDGRPSRSHFLIYGPGCVGPDIRATVEMGFDPVLTPAFHRPYAEAVGGHPSWAASRITDVDLVPSRSCRWLYRSLRLRADQRAAWYERLREGARSCWPGVSYTLPTSVRFGRSWPTRTP
jgi:uncharacterized protein (DUF362 family)